jgi:hypothetical protein
MVDSLYLMLILPMLLATIAAAATPVRSYAHNFFLCWTMTVSKKGKMISNFASMCSVLLNAIMH